MSKKINIGSNSKVEIKWRVLPIDYTHELEENIRVKFANKYGISKENVKVSPVFIMKSTTGDDVPFQSDITANIQDPIFQQNLFKEYLAEKGVVDYDYDEIIKIDNEINAVINYDAYEAHKKYTIKWIKWDNFMSYGKGNYFDFTKLNGLVLLSSEPANQGGKTTFCLDLIRFLLFGKVTSRESDWTLSKVFNNHLPNETECVVEGCISIDGNDYVIKRTVTRPQLSKRTDKSKVAQKINYYRLVNDEYIDLVDEECQQEVSNRETNKVIKEAIGNERDFDLMICVDSDNLKSLISLKDTDRGRLISRWVGLLPLEEKDKIAREKYNHEILPNLTINRYNKEELKGNNELFKQENENLTKENTELEVKSNESQKKIDNLTQTKETLLSSKLKIDDSLLKVDVVSIENRQKSIKEEGTNKRAEKNNNEKHLKEIGEVNFDQKTYTEKVSKKDDLTYKVADARSSYRILQNEIEALKKGEYCPTCGAKLKNVDNSKTIAEKTERLNNLAADGKKMTDEITKIQGEIAAMDKDRELFNEKVKIELLIQKIEVDIDNLTAKYRENERTLKDVADNKQAIEKNNQIENSINLTNENLKVEQGILDGLKQNITSNTSRITANKKYIEDNEKLISIIEKEEVILKNWKIYLDIIGKNGISKLVLRTVLPMINGELTYLLNGVCDFNVKVTIDDHNDVAFYLIHDGVTSNLASGSGFEQTVASLALRSVLSKISTFSKPSFVVFDEILGGVAEENYDTTKLLYDKIVTDYQMVLEITHNKHIFDWHKQNIIITKEKNISKIKMA